MWWRKRTNLRVEEVMEIPLDKGNPGMGTHLKLDKKPMGSHPSEDVQVGGEDTSGVMRADTDS